MKSFVLSSLFVFAVLHSFSQECKQKSTAFKDGEELKYAFSFKWGALWLSAGSATMGVKEETKGETPCFHVTGKGGTYKNYDWFFKVRDNYESYIEKNTLHPITFIRDINEGGYKLSQYVIFDRANQKAYSEKKTVPINNCTHDVISAVYYLRNIDMSNIKEGDLIPIPVYIDDSVYNLTIEYLGKETINNKYGKYETLKLKPKTVKGTIFKDEDGMRIWVTDDKNHIPVALSSPVLIGEIRVDLLSAKGLRNQMNGGTTAHDQ